MKLDCKYTAARCQYQEVLKSILLIFNKIKCIFSIEKWSDFDGETTNLLKCAVFGINDWRCEGGIFRRK